ncbi:MAG: FAD-binding oxidoreductase [Verrucomicrobia bacterium]|nr:FAD-binding oxidoreductase [Verrucomicrobiota bacterium]
MKALFIPIIALACCSFTPHCWQYKEVTKLPKDILEQFYPDQNAYRLFDQIPGPLQDISNAIYPISRGYDTVRFNYNKRFNVFPHAILTPKNAKELQAVFKKIKKYHLPFSTRSGGHCIEPASLSSGYIIDLRNFTKIKPDVKREEVYVGAGCRLGSVIKKLGKINYAIPTGTCSSVGATGLSLGGGIGVLGRIFGLTCDSIKCITILTAEGKILNVSKKHHPDLFWALRGAGNGSYGIVLGFTFKMHHVPKVSTLNLSWKWSPKTVLKVCHTWQEWVKTLPDTISTTVAFKYSNKQLSLAVTGLKVGDRDFTEWESAFRHLKPKVAVKKQSYLQSTNEWADRAPYPFLKSKSEIVMKPLTDTPIKTAIAFFEKLKAEQESYYAYFELDAFGGAIADGRSAFFPRKAFAWWYHVLYWDKEDMAKRGLHKLRKFHSEVVPYTSPYCYANIVDYDIGDDYLKVYYGDHVERLKHIKRRYDPENLFHWHQSIPVE